MCGSVRACAGNLCSCRTSEPFGATLATCTTDSAAAVDKHIVSVSDYVAATFTTALTDNTAAISAATCSLAASVAFTTNPTARVAAVCLIGA